MPSLAVMQKAIAHGSFSPKRLLGPGKLDGAWHDPSDLSTMFQDSAGTTPVTGVEQPVGLHLDKSGNGYHATQSITASRPTLSARYNLLTKTEDFADAVWLKQFSGTGSLPVVTSNYGVAPDGTQTADRVVFNLNGGVTTNDYSRITQIVASTANVDHTNSIYVRTNDGSTVTMQFSINGLPYSIITVTPEWKRFSFVGQRTDTGYSPRLELRGTFSGSDTADVLVWGADLRIGTSPGTYQRVNTATDYDSNPALFPYFLRYDGIDDYMNLPYMGLYASGAASVVVGISTSDDIGDFLSESLVGAVPQYYRPIRKTSLTGIGALIRNDSGSQVLTAENTSIPVGNHIYSSIDSGANIKIYSDSLSAVNSNYSRAGTLTLGSTTLGALIRTAVGDVLSMNYYGQR